VILPPFTALPYLRDLTAALPSSLDQVRQALIEVNPSDVATLLIAYEPIWGIGTGHVEVGPGAQSCRRLSDRVPGGRARPASLNAVLSQLAAGKSAANPERGRQDADHEAK